MESLNLAIYRYFEDGLTYTKILEFLRVQHDIHMSLSSLKRWFKKKGMIRRPLEEVRNDREIITNAVKEEISESGADVGYRRIHRALKSQGFICRRDDVRQIIKQLNPEVVELRKRRRLHRRRYISEGPNYTWHIDGHDKLKPFGFSIHGCIDGFSRYLIWLEVSITNKKPEVIARYYLDAVKSRKGVPLQVKADDGTEHSLVEPIHLYLSSLHENSNDSDFSITTSPQNQRIESYWSVLQRDRLGWWRRFFQDLLDLGLLCTNDAVILDCIHYCFIPVIRKELSSIKEHWNAHIVSKSRNSGPSGRPSCMYHLPHLFEKADGLQRVDVKEMEEFDPIVGELPLDFSNEFSEFVIEVLPENEMKTPGTATEALHLYFTLLEKISQYT